VSISDDVIFSMTGLLVGGCVVWALAEIIYAVMRKR